MAIPRRYSHVVFGVIQAGLTSAVASAVAVWASPDSSAALVRWLSSWLLSWAMMLPVVVFAAPFIRRAVEAVTVE
ncbi:MAG: GNAT family acetyltransferase [Hyphomicrobiales bacterium]|nr:MAG: GNAT family acetyltransferase [Hyphomicrobiales bacterium]